MEKKLINWKTLGIILFIIVVFRIVLNIMDTGYDYYWHIKLGEYIINNKTVPTTDIFSWYGIANNLLWVSHEWLSGVILYLNKLLFGKYAVVIFCSTFYFLITLLLFKFNKSGYLKNIKFTLIYILAGGIILAASITPRPHLISYVLLIITFYLTRDFYENSNSKKIYFLPLVSLLWANFHGGSSNLPYIILGINFLGSILDKKMTNSLLKKYIVIFFFTFIAIAINPHGIRMLFYPYLNMFDSTMKNGITEWQRPSIKAINTAVLYLYILLCVYILLKKRNKLKKVDILLFLAFTYLSVSAIRFIPFIYITSSFFIFDYIDPCDVGLINYKLIIVVSIVCILFLFINLPRTIKTTNREIISKEIITYLQENKIERLYNYYDYGGYLIYNDIKVFYDGRADIYSRNIFQDGLDISELRNDYKEIIKTFNFDYYLIPKKVKLVSYLLDNNHEVIIESENCILLHKKALSN